MSSISVPIARNSCAFHHDVLVTVSGGRVTTWTDGDEEYVGAGGAAAAARQRRFVLLLRVRDLALAPGEGDLVVVPAPADDSADGERLVPDPLLADDERVNARIGRLVRGGLPRMGRDDCPRGEQDEHRDGKGVEAGDVASHRRRLLPRGRRSRARTHSRLPRGAW